MEFKRTPDACFNNLPDYPFEPNYIQVADGEGGELRMHYLDEGSNDGEVVLLMHGQPPEMAMAGDKSGMGFMHWV